MNSPRQKYKGIGLVACGATSYGLLSTFVKLAYKEGFSPAEVTIAQFITGLFALGFLQLLLAITPGRRQALKLGEFRKTKACDVWQLLLAGTSIGLTSTFYYFAVQFIPISIAIVLLMQSIWMGVVVEAILIRQWPSKRKILAMIAVWIGTLLTTGVLNDWHGLSWQGLVWGLLSGAAYTAVITTSNRVALELDFVRRSFYMLVGATLIVLLIAWPALMLKFDWEVFWKWGICLGIFGTLLPPLLFNLGMPLTGIGLGTIISAVEIPVSAVMAFIILNEPVRTSQWAGIILVLGAVILMNVTGAKSAPARR